MLIVAYAIGAEIAYSGEREREVERGEEKVDAEC